MSKTSYIESGKEAKLIEAKINEFAQKAWDALVEEKPELATKYKVRPLNVCYHKRPAGAWRIIPKVAEYLLRKGYATKTQKDILEEVRQAMPNQVIHDNIWSRELNRKEVERVKKVIDGTMAKPLDVKGCKTLSQIKKRLIAANRAEDGVYTFKPIIKIDKEMVVVGNDKLFPIIRKKTGDYNYSGIWVNVRDKRAFLRVDALVMMLME